MTMDYSDNNLNNKVFRVLKPVCDQLIINVNDKSLANFTCVLETLPPKAIQIFQKYISFPLEMQILQSSSNQQKQLLVDLLRKLVLSHSDIDTVDDLLKTSILLFKQVASSKDQTKVAEVSEELKLSVVLCLTQLWRSATNQALHNVYCKEKFPRISPVVFMLVQLARNERLVNLRVASLECLQVLCRLHSDASSDDSELLLKQRNVVRLMFPGIVSCCLHIANEPATLNHKVICANLSLWSKLLVLMMADTQTDPETADWLAETSQILTPVTEVVLRAQTHSHWQVRRDLALAIHNLLSSCSKNLTGSVGSLVCGLIVLSEDEMPQVSSPAYESLAQLSTSFLHHTGQPMLQLVESTFYNLLTRAPRILQGTDENGQLTCLSLLVGYLRLQGSALPQVLTSGPFLSRLLVTLSLICRLETSHITLLQDCSIRDVETDTVTHEPWKRLKYLNTSQKLCRFHELCSVLRTHADVSVITHALLDLLDSNFESSKEIVLLLNTILGKGERGSMSNEADLVKTVVSVYLQPSLWDVPVATSHGVSVLEAQSNIVQVSLLAEGVGLLAEAVLAEHFSDCLLRCLYPLLECAGSPLHTLAAAGLSAVQSVASVSAGGDVTALLCANVDYLSYHITTRLRRAHQCPGVLSVLSVVMRYTTVQVLPSLQEIIEDVLAQSYDEFQEHNTNGFLRVFLTFLMCVRGWQKSDLDSDATTDKPKFSPENSPLSSPSLVSQLLEYRRLLHTVESLEDKEDSDSAENLSEQMFTSDKRGAEEYEEEVEEVTKPVAPSVSLTVAVLKRALHFLPSKDEQRQILVLDILREGVLVLASHEDQLLPVVHKIWSPLVNRFQISATRLLVVHRAFLLLCTLASTARDFIRSRTLKEVLPALCAVLNQSAEASVLRDHGSAYRLTQQYKLQRAVLSRLGQLSKHLGLQEKEIHQLLVAASPYLSSHQPVPLQECCVGLFKCVGRIYPDLVWLQLVSLWFPSSTLSPPSSSPRLRTIEVDINCDETSEFRKNVSELLKYVETLEVKKL